MLSGTQEIILVIGIFEFTVGAGAYMGWRKARQIEKRLKPLTDFVDSITPEQWESAKKKARQWMTPGATEQEIKNL